MVPALDRLQGYIPSDQQEHFVTGQLSSIALLDLPYPFAFLPEEVWDAHNGIFSFSYTGKFGQLDAAGYQFFQPYDPNESEPVFSLASQSSSGGPPLPGGPGGAGLESWMNMTEPKVFSTYPFYGVSYMGNYSYVQAELNSVTNETCFFVFTEQIRCQGWEVISDGDGVTDYHNLCGIFRLEMEPRVYGTMEYALSVASDSLMPTAMSCNATVASGTTVSSSVFVQNFTPISDPMPYVECLRP